MAVLTDPNRSAVWADLMRQISAGSKSIDVTKEDLRAAVNAIDGWLDSNAASANTAIPQPARNALTASQKALIMSFVIQRRFLTVA